MCLNFFTKNDVKVDLVNLDCKVYLTSTGGISKVWVKYLSFQLIQSFDFFSLCCTMRRNEAQLMSLQLKIQDQNQWKKTMKNLW